MNSKQQPKEVPEWQGRSWSKDELKVARAQWTRCAEAKKMVFGLRPPVIKNMKVLCNAMAAADEGLRENLREPLIAGTTKYQALWDFVKYRCKIKITASRTESEQSLAHEADNEEEHTSFFGGAPEIGHSILQSTLTASPGCESRQIIDAEDQSPDDRQMHNTSVMDVQELF